MIQYYNNNHKRINLHRFSTSKVFPMYLGNSATSEGQVFPHGTKITYIGFTLSMILKSLLR